jgi:hypothetical protein
MSRNISFVTEPTYYEALGRFVAQFAGVEATLFWALIFHGKINQKVAQAIFSGTRVDQAMSFISRICEAIDPGEERRSELRDVFTQLRAINDVRNSLLHHNER